MARFFNDYDDSTNTSSSTNYIDLPWPVKSKMVDKVDKTAKKIDKHKDNLHRIQEEARKRDQKRIK